VLIGWIAVLCAIVYIAALFGVAWFGDRRAERRGRPKERPGLYALALSVYCTSWTFFGSVGVASRTGLDFLPIYIGPILMFTLGYPVLRRVIRVSKAERITSVADFLGARYGKSQTVAVVTTLIAVTAAIPYIALQLKAISASVASMVPGVTSVTMLPYFGDLALFVAFALALFAILFGTRHADATEHQDGMILAVAVEAVVKLLAFLAVGVFVTFVLFGGPGDLYQKAAAVPEIAGKFSRDLPGGGWIAQTGLALVACLLLPRQFHIAVVENNSPGEIRRAALLFPIYLVAINIFVVPIAVAGLLTLGGTVDADLFVLEVPHAAGDTPVALIAFLGGLSAATAMVIVESVALAIMISNEIVVPAVLRGTRRSWLPADMGGFILNVRRTAIVVVLFLGYAYYRMAGAAALASIGLLAFAAIAQLAPSFFGGLLWRRATARGAVAGMAAGFAVWAYTLLLPSFAHGGYLSASFVEAGPFGVSLLRPQAFFSIAFDPLTHGVFWSLLVNVSFFIGFSLSWAPRPIERLQANVFIPQELAPLPILRPVRTGVKVGELMETVARYLGEERTRRSYARFAEESRRGLDPKAAADLHTLRFSEQLLASAIGAASARLVLSLLLNRDDPTPADTQRLLDDAEQALHYNRDLLQTVLDRVDQGIAAFDRELRLVCWNRQFRQHLDLPPEFGQVGISLSEILRHLAATGLFGAGDAEALADRRLQELTHARRHPHERHPRTGRVLTIEPRPGGDEGLALVVTDITEQAESEAELVRSKATLEKRVAERTEELTRLNDALERATAAAEEANVSKTRFLAAAGHDILQPLNAARLYATALAERSPGSGEATLAANLGSALDGVEDILRAVLEISRLDAASFKPELQPFRLQELFERIRVDFSEQARAKSLELKIVACSVAVQGDPHLLGRILHNLVSNAIKYTPNGRVLVGCRRKRGRVAIEVVDTGIGIAPGEQKAIFKEFHRLESGARVAPGLGLGLSIVERIARLMNVGITLDSVPGRGTRVGLSVPLAAAAPAALPQMRAHSQLSPLSGMAILCIDNDDKILAGMTALLSGWGCAPIMARNAREAVRALRAAGSTPELMLVDYHLDEGDGLSAVADIRSRLGDEVPAILVTADRSPELRERAMKAGLRVLNKPIRPAALRALMAQSNARRPAAE
jgi:Na+/proline symporter/signal transduction histidine kinase/ActR/RegA family two-component response regulator